MKQVVSILETEFPDLKDNRLSFTTVKNFINGLQKDLSYTFYLFGTIIKDYHNYDDGYFLEFCLNVPHVI